MEINNARPIEAPTQGNWPAHPALYLLLVALELSGEKETYNLHMDNLHTSITS